MVLLTFPEAKSKVTVDSGYRVHYSRDQKEQKLSFSSFRRFDLF